jgi:hypothetical protein
VTLLVPLILLGFVATLLVILPGTRREVDPRQPAGTLKDRPTLPWIAGAVLLLLTSAPSGPGWTPG